MLDPHILHIYVSHTCVTFKPRVVRELCSSRCLASSPWRALHEVAGLLEMIGKVKARG